MLQLKQERAVMRYGRPVRAKQGDAADEGKRQDVCRDWEDIWIRGFHSEADHTYDDRFKRHAVVFRRHGLDLRKGSTEERMEDMDAGGKEHEVSRDQEFREANGDTGREADKDQGIRHQQS